MGSRSKRQQTIKKRNRERAVEEKRTLKRERKQAARRGDLPEGATLLPDGRLLMPDGTIRDREMPDETMPDGSMPEGGLPEDGLPEGGIPEGGIPEGGLPEGASAATENATPAAEAE